MPAAAPFDAGHSAANIRSLSEELAKAAPAASQAFASDRTALDSVAAGTAPSQQGATAPHTPKTAGPASPPKQHHATKSGSPLKHMASELLDVSPNGVRGIEEMPVAGSASSKAPSEPASSSTSNLFLRLYNEALAKRTEVSPPVNGKRKTADADLERVWTWGEWCDKVSAEMEDAAAKATALDLKGKTPPVQLGAKASAPAVERYSRLKEIDAHASSAVSQSASATGSKLPAHPASAQPAHPDAQPSLVASIAEHIGASAPVRAPMRVNAVGAVGVQRSSDKAGYRSRGATQSGSPGKQASRFSTPEWDAAGSMQSCTICGNACADNSEFCGRYAQYRELAPA